MILHSMNIRARFFQHIGFSISAWPVIALLFTVNGFIGVSSKVQAAESLLRTEANCTIGMAKGDKKTECRVPIPNGCTVAQFPGYSEPWADISKGGGTSCEFDQKHTDWKTSIVGTCQACQTEQCTGRFIVMFNCADNVPPANQSSPRRK
jgi:hypothetical protein